MKNPERQSQVDSLMRAAKPRVDGIAVGWCSAGSVDAHFCDSITGSLLWDRVSGGDRLWGTIGLQGGPRIVELRSQIVDSFLTSPALYHRAHDKRAEWLVMIDADMKWDPDAIHRLVDSAKANKCKIMGGLCIGGGYSSQFPTLYRCLREGDDLTVERIEEWPEGAVVKVDATGAAFLAVHADVFRAMAKVYATLPDGSPEPHPWFIEGRRKGAQFGEDIGFCMRARALGFDVMVDTSVEIGHMKRFEMTAKTWRESRP